MSLAHQRRGAVVLAVATAVSALGPVAAKAAPGTPAAQVVQAPRADFTLTILHANDLESSLLPVTGTDGGTYGGADRFVELIQQQQRAAESGKAGPGQASKRGVPHRLRG